MIFLVGFAAVVFAYFRLVQNRRNVAALPAAQRQLLYQQTIDTLERSCPVAVPEARLNDALTAHCQEQAHFLLGFPECDARCVQLVRSHLPPATR